MTPTNLPKLRVEATQEASASVRCNGRVIFTVVSCAKYGDVQPFARPVISAAILTSDQ